MSSTESGTSEVLILGGDGAGKSLLVRRLKELQNANSGDGFDESLEGTMPTVGVEINTIDINGLNVNLREIGSSISLRWDAYIPDCNHLVFVSDISDTGSIGSTMALLHEVLSCYEGLRNKPILLAFNKIDLCSKRSYTVAFNMLRVEELMERNGNISLVNGSCTNGSLATAVANWLHRCHEATKIT